ncbi:MAG: urate hydroxylase PuuD [Woeseia sp.]|nr:urate hydroxylase PuuD [Woeseia sp.]
MEAYIFEWLNLLGRWVHLVTGIAWIGSSFYFIWLDNHLQAPKRAEDGARGVGGELWSVHGGGFYHAQKYQTAPGELPDTLHWFKWEAYSTWISGMFLLALIYWYGANVYLIDPAVMPLSTVVAVSIGAAAIVIGWFFYDALCRSPLGRNDSLLGVILFIFVALLAWGLCEVFSGRGAYIHYGAVLGSIMVANVFFVIIPGQKRMVEAAARGVAPNPADGLRAKQRSVHNTYFTLPVLFVMTSNHFAMVYNHSCNWLILIAISAAGALIRVWFVARHKGAASPLPLLAAGLLFALVIIAIAPRNATSATRHVELADIRDVIETRCTVCHAAMPTHVAFPAAPGGVMLETDKQILAERERIYQQTVVTKAMPIGNLTIITDDERALIAAWYRSSAND